jgi:hypothetical protein
VKSLPVCHRQTSKKRRIRRNECSFIVGSGFLLSPDFFGLIINPCFLHQRFSKDWERESEKQKQNAKISKFSGLKGSQKKDPESR